MIKEQCYNCRNNGTGKCNSQIVFDGTSCEKYHKAINLEKAETETSAPKVGAKEQDSESSNGDLVYTPDYLKENSEIGGWLSFFLFSICAGGLLSLILPLVQFSESSVSYGSSLLAFGDVAFGGMFCFLAFYTLYSFCNRKQDAVFLAKLYVVLAFSSNLLSLFGGDFESSGFGSLPQIVRPLIWGVIWFIYLCVSNRVQEVIPSEYRAITSKDYYIAGAMIILPIVFWGLGIGEIASSNAKQEAAFVERTSLSEGEYTDGRIVFKCPDEFTCERQDLENPRITIFDLENTEIENIRICSDYDNDTSQNNFNSYWENWEDENAKDFNSIVECFEKRTVNKFSYWYKVVCYDTETKTYWRFVLLFDNASGKVCLISAYDRGYDNYMQELLESIRFQ